MIDDPELALSIFISLICLCVPDVKQKYERKSRTFITQMRFFHEEQCKWNRWFLKENVAIFFKYFDLESDILTIKMFFTSW